MYKQFLPTLDVISSNPDVGEFRIYRTGLLSNLHTLELYYINIQPDEKTLLEERIFTLVRQNPLIKCFKIRLTIDYTALVQLVTEYMPNLEDLDLDMRWQGNLKGFLENLPESIRKVRLKSVLHVVPEPQAQHPTMDVASQMARQVRSHGALESFIISETIKERKEEVFVRFLESCSSKLRVFKGLGPVWCLENKAITQALSSIGFVWTELRRHEIPYTTSDEDIARIITSSPWAVMDLFTYHLRSMATRALVENCDNLTSLTIVKPEDGDLEHTYAFTGTTMQTVLSKTKHLKSLYVYSHLKPYRMIAEDILTSEWATTTLEHLVVKIGVPRVYEHITDEDEGAVDIQRSREIQRLFLRRLGQQKHLKVLGIGGRVISDSTGKYEHQRDCLEFSLEAGLDELKDLKNLELIDIQHMDHRVGPSPQGLRPDDREAMERKVCPHHALESLALSGLLNGREEDVLIKFLESCSPKLKTFDGMGFIWCARIKAIAQALSSIGFSWTEIRREALSHEVSDSDIAMIITNHPLTAIGVYTSMLGSLAVKALVENCDNLTILNVMEHGDTALTGAHMQTILSRAKNLKSLQVHWLLSAEKISTRDIFMSKWATTSLEHIDFKIDVPRVHGHQITDKDDRVEENQGSRDIQRRLLRRLGQQKNLKRLIVGDPGLGDRRSYTTGLLSNLHTLELHSVRQEKNSLLNGRIFALVRQNPLIRYLKITLHMDYQALMQLVTKYMPSLEELDLDTVWQGDLQEFLENLPESIRKVRMVSVLHVAPEPSTRDTENDSANAVAREVRSHHQLESLFINGTFNEQKEDVLLKFFESCGPKLKTFSGTGFLWCIENIRTTTTALANFGFNWTELRPPALHKYESDSRMATVLAHHPWTAIEVYLHNLGTMAVRALVENCSHLTVLNIQENRRTALKGLDLQTILSRAKNLKSLQAHWLISDDKLSAMDILSSEWATTTLEHIDFKIDVLRVKDHEITREDGALQTSRNIQRQVLGRLGQQKHLKKLVIGGKIGDPMTTMYNYQLSCLEFTLEAGLDELWDLKQLELLDIHHMDHRVDVEELEWMVENWPRISEVSGILDSFRPPSYEVRAWLAANSRPSWR
ncbi:hypothetical protein EMPS_09170 [Entomortierella parvispora]|uniref:Uncharacterized protein n=1 Tax=Entomortierella parvispora TaxID=205924 RepID=A0A9P3LZS4_9FUNG|nr:hypothetical protein EMPS_09170 [Entomortierella parvispora]